MAVNLYIRTGQPVDGVSKRELYTIAEKTELDASIASFQASEASNFTSGDKVNLDNQSGVNTGDETSSTIQSKRPIKTINGESIEGLGDISIQSGDNNVTNINKGYLFKALTDSQTNINTTSETVINYNTINSTGYETSVFAPVTNGVQLLTDLENVTIHAGLYAEDNSGQRVSPSIAIRINGVRSNIESVPYIRRASGANEDTPVAIETFYNLPAGTVITASTIQRAVTSTNCNSISGKGLLSIFGFVPTTANNIIGIPAPVITSISESIIGSGASKDIIIQGGWFTPSTVVNLTEGTVNSLEYIDDNTIKVNITATSNNTLVDLTVSNINGEAILLQELQYLTINGTGVTGTFNSTFVGGIGVEWNNTGDVLWTTSTGTTPSQNTGALSSPTGGFAFVETSGTNTSQESFLETSNFSKIQTVTFEYHMFGTTMGDLKLEYSSDLGVTWSEVPIEDTSNTQITLSGSQQATQAESFRVAQADLSSLPVSNLRFAYRNYSNFTADACITNVEIIST